VRKGVQRMGRIGTGDGSRFWVDCPSRQKTHDSARFTGRR
jgi:hypothetical protein